MVGHGRASLSVLYSCGDLNRSQVEVEVEVKKPRIGLVGESVWTVDDSRFMILYFRGPYSVSSFEV